MQHSKPFASLSLALLLTGLGLGSTIQSAEARPPDWAPAWGYRCKENEKISRDKYQRKINCKRDDDDDRDRGRDHDRDDDDRRGRDHDRDDRFSNRGVLRSGTLIETNYSGRDRIVLRRNETLPLTLRVSRDIRDDRDRVVIRKGRRIEGELRPADGGVRFFARRLILTNGDDYRLDARSDVIRNYRDFRDDDLRDTVVSRAARILVGSILGDRGDLGNILGDVLEGRNQGDSRLRSDLVVVYPDRDLDLRLRSDLRIR